MTKYAGEDSETFDWRKSDVLRLRYWEIRRSLLRQLIERTPDEVNEAVFAFAKAVRVRGMSPIMTASQRLYYAVGKAVPKDYDAAMKAFGVEEYEPIKGAK